MGTTDGSPARPADEETTVTAHRSTPERHVFVERDNPDAWIATDLAVDVRE